LAAKAPAPIRFGPKHAIRLVVGSVAMPIGAVILGFSGPEQADFTGLWAIAAGVIVGAMNLSLSRSGPWSSGGVILAYVLVATGCLFLTASFMACVSYASCP
jgi:hypothetical protein